MDPAYHGDLGTSSPPPASARSFRSLRKYLSKLRIILVLVHMMDPYVSTIIFFWLASLWFGRTLRREGMLNGSKILHHEIIKPLPLKIVRPWVFVFSVGTEGTDISRGIVDQTMSYHLVLPFEPFPTFASWAPFHAAIMWSI